MNIEKVKGIVNELLSLLASIYFYGQALETVYQGYLKMKCTISHHKSFVT